MNEQPTDIGAALANLLNQEAASKLNTEFLCPPDDKFAEARDEFVTAPELRSLALNLFDACPGDFDFIAQTQFEIEFRWKRKGGESGGMLTLGKCVKLSGLLRHYSAATNDGKMVDFVVWVAADNTIGRFNYAQMYALIFHELLHIGVDEKGKPAVRGHEFEGFVREIEMFGAWKSIMESMHRAFNKHPLAQGELFEDED